MNIGGLEKSDTVDPTVEEIGGEPRSKLGDAKPIAPEKMAGVVIGDLIGIKDEGRTPLVLYPGQSSLAAIAAKTVIDLHGYHVGRHVVLMFEGAEPAKPIVMGILHDGQGWPLGEQPGYVEIAADGERLIISARDQVVLRCGKASLTLTKAGK
jgi:hypothetical protein